MIQRKLALLLLLILSTNLILAQQNNQYDEVLYTVNLYIDQTTNHYLDGQWKRIYKSEIYHPYINSLGIHKEYDAINDTIQNETGKFIYSEVTKKRIDSDCIAVNYSKNGVKETTYFVLLEYNVIATYSNKQLKFLDKPRFVYQYIVLAVDDNDQHFKIIDFYPAIEGRHFIGVPYILNEPDKFSLNTGDVEKITNEYIRHVK